MIHTKQCSDLKQRHMIVRFHLDWHFGSWVQVGYLVTGSLMFFLPDFQEQAM